MRALDLPAQGDWGDGTVRATAAAIRIGTHWPALRVVTECPHVSGHCEPSMSLETLCSRDLVTVPTGAPISDAARLMRDQNVGALVVTEGSAERLRVVGILTDRDIVRAQIETTADLASLSVGQAMTREPLVLAQGESIDGAIACLRARGVRRAPVVRDDGAPVGLISVDDLIARLAASLMGLAGILAQQTRRHKP
jgi:CBS domain-containing protein